MTTFASDVLLADIGYPVVMADRIFRMRGFWWNWNTKHERMTRIVSGGGTMTERTSGNMLLNMYEKYFSTHSAELRRTA